MLLAWVPVHRREHIESGPVGKLCLPSGPGKQGSVQRHCDPAGGVAERSKQQRDRDVTANPHTPAVDDDDHQTSAAAGLPLRYSRVSLTPAPLMGQSCCGRLAPASVVPIGPVCDVCDDNAATTPVSWRTARFWQWRPLCSGT